MSRKPINLSPKLKALEAEGYDLEIRGDGTILLVKGVPFVTANRTVSRGTLAMTLTLTNDKAGQPKDHTAYFMASEYPCDRHGQPLSKIDIGLKAPNTHDMGDNIVCPYGFSAKPKPEDNYPDFYAKVTAYVGLLSGPAGDIEPGVTAKTFPLIPPEEGDDSVFLYADTASGRAEIGAVTERLKHKKVAIIGLGGTGGYVFDLVAKTPVAEIHLFDKDVFDQHNAFRAPGAASGDELDERLPKVTYFARIYRKMRKGIFDHPAHVSAYTMAELAGMDFVFVCVDDGPARRRIVRGLEELGLSFIDVGMGIYFKEGALGGHVRVTLSTPGMRDHFDGRVSYSEGDEANEYDRNIQVAPLNSLNASLAVIKWLKLAGYFHDDGGEHFSVYAIGGNHLSNEDSE